MCYLNTATIWLHFYSGIKKYECQIKNALSAINFQTALKALKKPP